MTLVIFDILSVFKASRRVYYNSGGPGKLSIPIRFYYRIRELNYYFPGLLYLDNKQHP
jgi:hypothetical protein